MSPVQTAFAVLALVLTAGGLVWTLHPLRGERLRAGRLAAVAVPLLAVAIYVSLGTPKALEAQVQAPAHAAGAADLAAMVQRLEARLRDNPEDLEGWFMLARSHQVMEQWEAAATAYRRALALAPEDAGLLADLADVLAVISHGALEGEPRQLLERALQADPAHAKTLLLLAAADVRQGRVSQARERWERLLRTEPPESRAAAVARESLEQATQLQSPPRMR